ncbi:MAG: type I 3-dehydroquinate dehydratase [Clostridia bacterium]|nr:type I 3-dehydroquinate dehydratase [Clostridia bacterium]
MLKIVTLSESEEDLWECVKTMTVLKKEVKTPISYHVCGKTGVLSRILNPILGGQIAFCVDRYSESSTMEQLDLKTAKTIIDNMKKFM